MNIIIDEEIRLFGDTARHLAATLFNECLQFLCACQRESVR